MRTDCIIPAISNGAIDYLTSTKLSYKEIGKIFGCSRGPIYRIAKLNNITRPNIRIRYLGKCKWCGIETILRKNPRRPNRGKFCSKKCYTSWQESLDNKGSKHPNWVPGAKREKLSHRARKSRSWKRWRTKVYQRDNYTCILCGRTGCLVDPHHILPRRDFSKIRYRLSNGATLCRRCHRKTFRKEYEFVELIVEKLFGGMNRWKLSKRWLTLKNQKIGSKKQLIQNTKVIVHQ
jgi:5-methylcytosine-specific restriction endonuclease McrA